MHVQLRRNLFVDLAQEVQKFLVPVLRSNTRDHLPVGDIERSEQCRGAVTNVVMRDAFDVAQVHGQNRLPALQRLDLTLLVHA